MRNYLFPLFPNGTGVCYGRNELPLCFGSCFLDLVIMALYSQFLTNKHVSLMDSICGMESLGRDYLEFPLAIRIWSQALRKQLKVQTKQI